MAEGLLLLGFLILLGASIADVIWLRRMQAALTRQDERLGQLEMEVQRPAQAKPADLSRRHRLALIAEGRPLDRPGGSEAC